jgi:hypothetical protein
MGKKNGISEKQLLVVKRQANSSKMKALQSKTLVQIRMTTSMWENKRKREASSVKACESLPALSESAN